MKTSIVVILAAALGALCGAASGIAAFRWHDPASTAMSWGAAGADARIPTPDSGARVVVDEPEFDFGEMERGTTRRHSFGFLNEGDAPLQLVQGDTTCKCTISNLERGAIPPGGSANVTLEWEAVTQGDQFRQSATVYTNDPTQERVELTVFGSLVQQIVVEPATLVFSRVPAGESWKSEDVLVYSQLRDDLHVVEHRWKDTETADFYQLEIEPFSMERQIPAVSSLEPPARSGARLSITLQPGLPVGHFAQRLILSTTLETAQEVEIPIQGRVVSDISIIGKQWVDSQSTLRIGTVSNQKLTQNRLSLIVRGEHAADVEMSVKKVHPPWLRVQFGERTLIRKGEIVNWPLVIEIPAGRKPANFLGGPGNALGEVWISTTHPQASELQLRVSFAVTPQ